MTEVQRPHETRRRHREAMERARLRRRKRRKARLRRIRTLRAIRSLRFWSKAGVAAVCILGVVFWAKFALVYNIPSYAQRGPLTNVRMYVTSKSWWFGPPVFDLQDTYGTSNYTGDLFNRDPYLNLVTELGRYQDIILEPNFVWVSKGP